MASGWRSVGSLGDHGCRPSRPIAGSDRPLVRPAICHACPDEAAVARSGSLASWLGRHWSGHRNGSHPSTCPISIGGESARSAWCASLTRTRWCCPARHGRLSLPHGRVAPGEDVWDDTVRRVPMTSAGFRHQGTHVFAIDRAHRHAIFWVDGAFDDRTSQDVHTSATALSVDAAVRSLEGQGDFALARLITWAADHRQQMTYEQHQRDGDRTTVNLYLRASTPQGGSGYEGSDQEWRAARACLAVALDGLPADLGRAENSVSFLDVGCANGHLPASFVTWGAERGVSVDPYGIDIVPELVDRARKLHPQWADHFWTGNMLDWQHPDGKVFDLVHVLLDGVPPDKFAQAIANCANLVTPGGRLLVSSYDMRPELAAQTVMTQLGIHVDGRTPPRSWQSGMPGQPSAWTRIAPR